MLLSNDTIYKCECCGKNGTKYEIEVHEPECREKYEKKQKQLFEFIKKYQQRIDDGVKWAQNNKAIKVLIVNECYKEAEYLIENWVKYNTWDCGSSSGFHSTVKKILELIRENDYE